MAYHDWHVGMKVVCVKNTVGRPIGWRGAWNDNWPSAITQGGVYTIRAIITDLSHLGCDVAIRLQEYHHPINARGWETAFHAVHFRKVQERKTDISIFTAMLNRKKHEVDA